MLFLFSFVDTVFYMVEYVGWVTFETLDNYLHCYFEHTNIWKVANLVIYELLRIFLHAYIQIVFMISKDIMRS